MAEYLCEEDMNTGEYISRDLALKQLNATCLATDCDNYNGVRCRACAYADAMDFIDAIPAADVQPVDRWISVKERLPESEKEVLVWYRYIWGDRSTSYGFGISWWYSNAKQWRDGCLLKGVEVLYWQPLPEPPKDGDKANNVRNLTDEETEIYESWIDHEAKDTGVNIMDGDT